VIGAPTIYLSRLIGILALGVATTMLLDKPTFVATAEAIFQDRALMLARGLVGIGLGTGIVLVHNIWTRGPWPLVVTLFGWMLLLRGVWVLLLPADLLEQFVAAFHFLDFFYAYAAIPLVLGAYLSLRGFSARS
jgi:hypothetical protein